MDTAVLRGYLDTGNASWLTTAENEWNAAYNRGWTSAGGGGIWEDMNSMYSKCSLSNNPMASLGVMLYRITGDGTYLTKAEQIYSWVRSNLVNTTTGVVNECIAFPNGVNGSTTLQASDNAYNAGSFIEAADNLYRVTGNTQYYNDAQLTANHFIKTVPIVANNQERGPVRGAADQRRVALLRQLRDQERRQRPVEIKNQRSGQLLNVSAASGALGGSIVQWLAGSIQQGNDQWLPVLNADGTYSFYNRNSQLALDDPTASTAAGTQYDQWAPNDTNGQKFTLISRTSGTAPTSGTGPVRSGVSGKCLDLNGGNPADGTAVQLWTCNGTAVQSWTQTSANALPVSGRCLDDPGASATDGTRLELWDCNGTAAQIWSLPGA